jgi:hypothetical protein
MSFSKCTSIWGRHIPLNNISILTSETPTGVSQNALLFAEETLQLIMYPPDTLKRFCLCELYHVDLIPSLLIDETRSPNTL